MSSESTMGPGAAMGYDEDAWRAYVAAYDVEVSRERVAQELQMIRADLKHRMIYDQMTGGGTHFFPEQELAEQEEELLAAALFEAKEPLVLRDLAAKLDVVVTSEELLAEAEAMAQRQNTTIAQVKRFFGEDLALLSRDVRDNKIRAWACSQ